jgi:hypothetical protein
MYAPPAITVGTGHQHGGLAVGAVAVDNSYAVIQVAPFNPAAIHKTALFNGADSNQRRPRPIRSKRSADLRLCDSITASAPSKR